MWGRPRLSEQELRSIGNKSILKYQVCILLVLTFYIEEECNDSFDYYTSMQRYQVTPYICVHTVLYNIRICLYSALIIRHENLHMFC